MRVTQEALDAYRARLRSVAWRTRWAGVVLIILGTVAAVANHRRGYGHGSPLEIAAIVLTVAGWGLIAVAFRKRNAYHRRENPTPRP